jgi:hypothetical protein
MRDAILDGSAKKKSVATHSRASATCLTNRVATDVTPSKYPEISVTPSKYLLRQPIRIFIPCQIFSYAIQISKFLHDFSRYKKMQFGILMMPEDAYSWYKNTKLPQGNNRKLRYRGLRTFQVARRRLAPIFHRLGLHRNPSPLQSCPTIHLVFPPKPKCHHLRKQTRLDSLFREEANYTASKIKFI